MLGKGLVIVLGQVLAIATTRKIVRTARTRASA